MPDKNADTVKVCLPSRVIVLQTRQMNVDDDDEKFVNDDDIMTESKKQMVEFSTLTIATTLDIATTIDMEESHAELLNSFPPLIASDMEIMYDGNDDHHHPTDPHVKANGSSVIVYAGEDGLQQDIQDNNYVCIDNWVLSNIAITANIPLPSLSVPIDPEDACTTKTTTTSSDKTNNNHSSDFVQHIDLTSPPLSVAEEYGLSLQEGQLESATPLEIRRAAQQMSKAAEFFEAVAEAVDDKKVTREFRRKARCMSEAAQFYEAVGEIPPLKDQEIIEDSSLSGSDQDNDNEEEEEEEDEDEDDNEINNDLGHHTIQEETVQQQQQSEKEEQHQQPQLPEKEQQQPAEKEQPQQTQLQRHEEDISEDFNNDNRMKISRRRNRVPSAYCPFAHRFPVPDNIEFREDEIYKGVSVNNLEVTKRGITRGNASRIHRKAWLEVSDRKHRYGKNLRMYYKHWESIGYPTNNFFDWLDSKGEAAGEPLPELEECQRKQLDSDTVLYIDDNDVTKEYELSIDTDEIGRCRFLDSHDEPVRTGEAGWIFVIRDNEIYAAPKVTSIIPGTCNKQRFHHSTFFGGKAVAGAGILVTDDNGYLIQLYPHSGHYRPGEADVQRTLYFLHKQGVDLRTFLFDTQQLIHINRKGTKKMEAPYLETAIHVAHFLSHKARSIGAGIFSQIHQINNSVMASAS